VYKRFIKKNGVEIGPYFYHSVKMKDGRVRSIYLGSDMDKAKKRLELLELDALKEVATKPVRQKPVEDIFQELEQVNAVLNEPT